MLEFNHLQSSSEELNLSNYPQEIQDSFFEALNTIPFVQSLIAADRPRAKDLPRDAEGKIIIDITKPHILEDMDYFRPAALHYKKTGRYTDLRPNVNPNSEFGKWIREEVRRCYEGYVRESDGEWITGDYYFFLNYCPMSLAIKEDESKKKAKRVLDFPRVWEGHYLKFHYLHQAREHGMHAGELAARSKGKAHPYSQIVYTPEGKKLWRDIKIGDYLYGDDGIPTKVIDIPYDEYSDIYKVTLSDNRVLYCTLGHLFKVKDSRKKGKNKYTVKSLEEIINGRYKILRKNGTTESYVSIYKSGAVEFKYSDTLIDPYTLGLLLGDGCFRTNYKNVVMFSSSSEDINTYKKHCPYEISKVKGKYSYRVWIKDVAAILERYNLNKKDSSNKHIPEEYLYNSKEVRLNILKGLMDSDGTVNNNGIPMFITTSLELCENIIWLCRSLGYNTRMFKKQGKYNNKVCKLTYNISILTNDPIFNLQRKLDKLTSFPTAYSRSRRDWTHITNIEYSHKEQAKCVTVDNDSHCYLIGDFVPTHNSFSVAALLAKRFVLGESKEVNKKVTCYITAAEKKFLVAGDQTLDKFQFNIDWNAQHTEFPSRRLTSSINNMQWRMGYKDIDTGTEKGTLNSVIGVTSKDDESKLRGSRGVLYVLEEWGTFPKLLELYNNLRPSVEDGEDVFGMIVGVGTSGDSQSDFASAQEIMTNPKGYNMYALPNVFDKEGQGKREFVFFFPGYINRAGCYDENGNSNVTKALLEIYKDRYTVKYNSSDVNSITKRIAEIPITPQEAMQRVRGNMFPITELSNRLYQLDANPSEMDEVYVGTLAFNTSKEVVFVPTTDLPIKEYPLQDNKAVGALEIFKMPEKDASGKIPADRYIASLDPVDADQADTLSLCSIFVLDLWTDKIVCEYTGRHPFAEDNYELLRKICLYYNAKCLYENNLKGTFSYFSKMNSLYLLADTPSYLRDKDLIKGGTIGNTSKGVNASLPINNYANRLIRDWLLKPSTFIQKTPTGEEETTLPNLFHIKNRALLKELILYHPDLNCDRIRSLGMLMLYREEKMILYQGDFSSMKEQPKGLEADDFFVRNSPKKRHSNKNITDVL